MQSMSLSEAQRRRAEQTIGPLLPTLLRTARILTGRDGDAQDLAQETMMKAIRAIDSFRDGSDARAWLLTILRRTHIDHRRAAQRHPPPLSLDAQDAPQPQAPEPAGVHDEAWTDPAMILQEFADADIIAALQELPPDIRWTLLLVDVEGLDHADAAAVLEVPAGTVKSRTHRGRAMLRDRLHEFAQQRGWVAARRQTP